MPKPRRRQVIVDAPMQFGIGLHLVGWLYLYVVTFAILCNGPAMLDLINADAGSPEYAQAVLRIRSFGGFVIVPLVLTFVAMAAHGVYLTHRVAGPVFRLKMSCAEVLRGHIPETVRLRDKDYLKDLAHSMEQAFTTIRADNDHTRDLVAQAKSEARQISDAIRSGVDGHVGVVVDRLLDVCRSLEAHMDDGVEDPAFPTADEIADGGSEEAPAEGVASDEAVEEDAPASL